MSHRPVWANREQARIELNQQSQAIADETGGSAHVSAVVIDASLF